ncbi:MAG: ATP-binding protein [Saprospiraceae bacterium]|jgi:signal transduction histidine kinase
MLRCIIVDDCPVASTNLRYLCNKYPSLTLVESFLNPDVALAFLTDHLDQVDLLFLDIEMPEMNGMQFLDRMLTPPMVIFTTTNPMHAYDAFEYKAIDFLKKPISKARFEQAVEKAILLNPKNELGENRTNMVIASIRKLNEEKRSMISILAHDLRNPLFSLQMKAANLKLHQSLNKMATDIEIAVHRIQQLTNLILKLEEDESMDLHKIMVPFALAPLINNVLKHLQLIANSKKVRINFKELANNASILAEPTLLEHIFENILSNAIKFSPEYGIIDVIISDNLDHTLMVRIKDSGPGIASQKMAGLFEKKKLNIHSLEQGIGIGLSLSKKFADLMHIEMGVENSTMQGTTVYLKIPKCNS